MSAPKSLEKEAVLFPVRPALWYVQRRPLGEDGQASQGGAYFVAENPPYGAVFTYHLGDDYETLEKQRREAEEALEKEWKDTPYVGYDALEAERRQPAPEILLTIRDADGEIVRTITGPAKKGFHRVAWDLRYPSSNAIELVKTPSEPWERGGNGHMAPPGSYTVSLAKRVDGMVTELGDPAPFEVIRVLPGSLEGTPPAATATYMADVSELRRAVSAADEALKNAFGRVAKLEEALAQSTTDPGTLDSELESLRQKLHDVDFKLAGNRTIADFGHPQTPNVSRRLRVASISDGQSDYGPTATHRRAFEIARAEFAEILPELKQLIEIDLPALEAEAEAEKVPWTPGRPLPATP